MTDASVVGAAFSISFSSDCETRTDVRVRVRRSVIRIRIRHTAIRIRRIVGASQNIGHGKIYLYFFKALVVL